MITVSLKQILKKNPCLEGWANVLYGQRKITKKQLDKCLEDDYIPISYSKLACDTQFPLSAILESNGLADCLWAFQCVDDKYYPLLKKYAVWCARQVQHLMKDQRSLDALDVAWRYAEGHATDEEMVAAWRAAIAATTDAVKAAGNNIAVAVNSTAARAADCAAAIDTTYVALSVAVIAAVRSADRKALMDTQAKKLKQIIDLGYWVD